MRRRAALSAGQAWSGLCSFFWRLSAQCRVLLDGHFRLARLAGELEAVMNDLGQTDTEQHRLDAHDGHGEPACAGDREDEDEVGHDDEHQCGDRDGRPHEQMLFVEMTNLGMGLEEVVEHVAQPEGADGLGNREYFEEERHGCS